MGSSKMGRCLGVRVYENRGFGCLCVPLIICLVTFKIFSNDGNLVLP